MKELKGIKIGKYYIEKPIVQGGMGVGVSWDQLSWKCFKKWCTWDNKWNLYWLL